VAKFSRLVKDIIKFFGAPIWLIYLFWRGFFRSFTWKGFEERKQIPSLDNPMFDYFKSHREGPGIWKWNHYFDIYHRHFNRFRGQQVNILEIGIYSGGSLAMWKQYFGPNCRVFGVDIIDDCKVYENDSVKIFIGNQADRKFWRRFWAEVPRIDIIIDDGGHRTDQQIITLEETLAQLSPGGVYLCEDVHGTAKGFTAYVDGLIHQLSAATIQHNVEDSERRMVVPTQDFQSQIESIHCYPFVTVIEKRREPMKEFVAPRHGTQWQPFLK
jgi:hypothetical protein